MLLSILLAAVVTQGTNLAALQKSLNAAISDDKPIRLVVGDDFEALPGTVIFVSRDEGIRRLVALARQGKLETSLTYLPRWGAWITEAEVRTVDITSADIRYCAAAMQSEPEVQLWHFHNIIGMPDIGGELNPLQATMMWSVPSALDLEEMYAWAELKPTAKFRGYVAGVHGVVEYWSGDYDSAGPLFYLRLALASEARNVKMAAKDAGPATLAAVLSDYRGVFWYRFTPVP